MRRLKDWLTVSQGSWRSTVKTWSTLNAVSLKRLTMRQWWETMTTTSSCPNCFLSQSSKRRWWKRSSDYAGTMWSLYSFQYIPVSIKNQQQRLFGSSVSTSAVPIFIPALSSRGFSTPFSILSNIFSLSKEKRLSTLKPVLAEVSMKSILWVCAKVYPS